MRILILGFTNSGKTTFAEMLRIEMALHWVRLGTTELYVSPAVFNSSDIIIADYCKDNRIPLCIVKVCKGWFRKKLYKYGQMREKADPAYTYRPLLERDDIILTGLRTYRQVEVASRKADVVMWVSRPGCKAGPTDKMHRPSAARLVYNNGSLADLQEKAKLVAESLARKETK